MAYTSRSATPDRQKAHLLVPLAEPVAGDQFVMLQTILNDKLEAAGITPDTASQRTGQICFLPNRGDFYQSDSIDFLGAFSASQWADELKAKEDEARALEQEQQRQREAARLKAAQRIASGEQSPVNAFNAEYPIELLFNTFGYMKKGGRWLSPNSSSRTPGVTMTKDRGKWLSTHHSDTAIGKATSNGTMGDAFDLFVFYEHGGDYFSALKAAGEMFTTADDVSITKAHQRNYMAAQDEQQALVSLAAVPEQSKQEKPKATREELVQRIADADSEDFKVWNGIMSDMAKAGLSRIEESFLINAVKAKTGTGITDLKAQLKECRATEKEAPTEQDIAALTLDGVGSQNLIHANQSFHRWDKSGVWRRVQDQNVKQAIHGACDAKKIEYTANRVNAVTDLLRTETFRQGHQFDVDREAVNCLNGQLRYQDGDWVLESHQREHYRITQIPVVYDPEAKAPRFEQFLSEIFDGDPDQAEKSLMVKEVIGYTLLSTCRYEKFALLVGSGANGKSVLLGLIESLLGRDNICAVQPSKFENPFQRAHMEGKLANIVTEIAEGAEMADAQTKAIVSGELTTAEHKNKDPFDFRPFATCLFGTNHLPHTRDFSDALFRRAIVLEFPNKFPEGDPRRDPKLKGKLLDELPGVLNLALLGGSGVMERGAFTSCAGSEEAKKRWRLEADQVQQFVEDRCEPDPVSFTPVGDLYRDYREWAGESGIQRTVNKLNFGARLEKLGFKRERQGKSRTRGHGGLYLKPSNNWPTG